MKTALLFTGGADSTYLAYKLLSDTKDDLTLVTVTTPENFSDHPLWSARPDRVSMIKRVIQELKLIREFSIHDIKSNLNDITFELDHPAPYAVKKLIPFINNQTYDRVAMGYSWDQQSLQYFKNLILPGISGDKISKKIFDREAKRGGIWLPLMTHEIDDKYGRYHALKNLPSNLKDKLVSCLRVNGNHQCGNTCGKCLTSIIVQKMIDEGYSAGDIEEWTQEKSLSFGGGKRHAPSPLWLEWSANKFSRKRIIAGLNHEIPGTVTIINSKEEFVQWWDTFEFNFQADRTIIKWKKTIDDYLSILV
jgi:hypothetical protein